MDFPPTTLVVNTINTINRFMHNELGQPQSSIHEPYVVDMLQREYVMLTESGHVPDEKVIMDRVVSRAKGSIRNMAAEYSTFKVDENILPRPTTIGEYEETPSFARIMSRGEFTSHRKPINVGLDRAPIDLH
jgi:hypothetical protein